MRMRTHLWVSFLFALIFVAGASGIAGPLGPQAAKPEVKVAKGYVCPPCDSPCDKEAFDKPGICPTCHMNLVEAGSKEAEAPVRKKVAILIFDGVEIIDYTGPYEIFGVAGFEVYTVAATKNPITTYLGMIVTPNYSLTDAPQPDVLVIPGGGVNDALIHEPTLRYIKDVSAHAEHTMSVCNGAFILANTGLLDGLTATTTRGNIPGLTKKYPKIKVVGDQRYTDNGKIITTGGLSAGIDGALHIIEKLLGTDAAQKVAYLEEYHWQRGTKLVGTMPVHPGASIKATKAGEVYVCPMVEHPKTHAKPGKCALCDMELVRKAKPSSSNSGRK